MEAFILKFKNQYCIAVPLIPLQLVPAVLPQYLGKIESLHGKININYTYFLCGLTDSNVEERHLTD